MSPSMRLVGSEARSSGSARGSLRAVFGLLLGLLGGGLLLGCGPASRPSEGASRPTVIATTGIVADLVRHVAGEDMAVVSLMGPGVDPHLYRPTARDVALLKQAKAVVLNGLQLEGKMGEILSALAREKPGFAVAEHVPRERLLFHGAVPDPHVWMDPSLWAEATGPLAEFLARLDPGKGTRYRENAARVRKELLDLHHEVKAILSAVRRERRLLITAHDAFGYFGRAFDFEVRGVQGLSTESEAGLRDVEELVRLIVRRRLPAVFVESTLSPRNVRALVEGASRAGVPVRIGGELYGDALGDPDGPAGTYFGMVRHNAETIAEALR